MFENVDLGKFTVRSTHLDILLDLCEAQPFWREISLLQCYFFIERIFSFFFWNRLECIASHQWSCNIYLNLIFQMKIERSWGVCEWFVEAFVGRWMLNVKFRNWRESSSNSPNTAYHPKPRKKKKKDTNITRAISIFIIMLANFCNNSCKNFKFF